MEDDNEITGRDHYLMQEAVHMTGTRKDATRAELARALLDAADILELAPDPPMSTITDMRTLLREGFMDVALGELVAREKRRAIKPVSE